MTTRVEILEVAREYDWRQVPGTTGFERGLSLYRLDDGDRYTMWVEFDWNSGRVAYAETNGNRLTGGAEAIKAHLRRNGVRK